MQFIKHDIDIKFIEKRKIALYISTAMILLSIVSLIFQGGPKYGIDFAGGTLIQVKFDAPVTIKNIKAGLKVAELEKPTVQLFGNAVDNEFLVRIAKSGKTDTNFSKSVETALTESTKSAAKIRRVEMVGPQVGKDLREKALLAMLFSLLFITIYISGRFELKWVQSGVVAGSLMLAVYVLSLLNMSIPLLFIAALALSLFLFWKMEFKYAMGAIVALIHDITITVGIFSLTGKEFTLPIIAALLTIIGYSLNDTIIVYDRIRENSKKHEKKPLAYILDRSINETLSRTILTSLTTLAVVAALFVLGGGIIHDFAFALLIGVGVGTYSSIFVASPILLAWHEKTAAKS